jgi:predicted dehydrogenase
MSDRLRWGILGTGFIAREFATALGSLPDSEVVAVGSRRQETADAFGDAYGVPRRYDNYAALTSDPKLDIVYIATPHMFHHRDAMMALEAGKHVLVEKAFTINAREAEQVVELARSKKLFAMEAMWTRFFPLMERLRGLIAGGAIGEVQMLRADLSHRIAFDPAHRLYDPHQGGGALLDIGIYPISLAWMVLGKPDSVTGLTHIGRSGVDNQSACLFGYRSGAIAILSFSQTTDAPREALICGTRGFIRVHGRWIQPARMTISRGQTEEVVELPYEGNGYQYEAVEVMDCLRTSRTESEVMPLDQTLDIMKVMDQLREGWGLKYPGE